MRVRMLARAAAVTSGGGGLHGAPLTTARACGHGCGRSQARRGPRLCGSRRLHRACLCLWASAAPCLGLLAFFLLWSPFRKTLSHQVRGGVHIVQAQLLQQGRELRGSEPLDALYKRQPRRSGIYVIALQG